MNVVVVHKSVNWERSGPARFACAIKQALGPSFNSINSGSRAGFQNLLYLLMPVQQPTAT